MTETLLSHFEWLANLNPIVYTVVIAFIPLIELRGSIPAALLLGMRPMSVFIWSVVGSILPAFFVIPLFAWGLNYLEEKKLFPRLTNFLNRKFVSKAEKMAADQKIIAASDKKAWQKELLKFWGLAIFVGVPLPGTGVWTGAAIASILKMPFHRGLLSVFIGDLIAGGLVLAASLGLLSIFR